MTPQFERVSCLMITERRFQELQRSFACFCNQDYPDKELIIVTSGSEEYRASVLTLIESSGRKDVHCVFCRSGMKLGALRNLAVQHASGPLVCQWDDDDLYHPKRLDMQVRSMRKANADATFLLDNFHLFLDSRQLYWLSWTRSPHNTGFPSSLLAYKDALPPYDETLSQHEDALVQREIYRRKTRTSILSGCGYLYVYVYHGTNTFNRHHHAMLARAYGLEEATLRDQSHVIRGALQVHGLQPPLSVTDQMGREIFVWEGQSDPELNPEQKPPSTGKIFVVNHGHEGANVHLSELAGISCDAERDVSRSDLSWSSAPHLGATGEAVRL